MKVSSLPSLSSNMSNIDQGALDMSAKNASFLKFLKLLGDIYVGFGRGFLRFSDATMRS